MIRPTWHLRIARPARDLPLAARMYTEGLGLAVIDEFRGHAGFDGVMVGRPDLPFHFEFTACRTSPVVPRPTHEDLVVFYVPDIEAWQHACERMRAAGFAVVEPLNPYWGIRGRTYEDPDGYRTVLQHGTWSPTLDAVAPDSRGL